MCNSWIILNENIFVQYAEEDQVTEKVISMSLDLVHFNEAETCLLIDSLLQEESEENVKMDSSINTSLEVDRQTTIYESFAPIINCFRVTR